MAKKSRISLVATNMGPHGPTGTSNCISAPCSFCVCRGTTGTGKCSFNLYAGKVVIFEYEGPSRKLEVA